MLGWLGVVCTHTSAIYSVVNIDAPETPFLRHTCHDGRMNRKIARAHPSQKVPPESRIAGRRESSLGESSKFSRPFWYPQKARSALSVALSADYHVEMIDIITSISSASTVHDHNLHKNNSDLPVASVTSIIIKDTTTKRVAGMLCLGVSSSDVSHRILSSVFYSLPSGHHHHMHPLP